MSRRGLPSRPLRVQAAQPLVVEGVEEFSDRFLVSGDQAGDDRDGVTAEGGQDHHRPLVAHAVGAAPADDALQFLALKVSESVGFEGGGHYGSQG